VQAEHEGVAGQLVIDGEIGKLGSDVTYAFGGKPSAAPPPEGLLAALLAGESITLPDFSVKADGTLALARLAQAVPALLAIRPDVMITSGQLVVEDVSVQGGERPAALGAIRLTDMALRRGEQPVALEPITLDFNAAVEADGLQVRQ